MSGLDGVGVPCPRCERPMWLSRGRGLLLVRTDGTAWIQAGCPRHGRQEAGPVSSAEQALLISRGITTAEQRAPRRPYPEEKPPLDRPWTDEDVQEFLTTLTLTPDVIALAEAWEQP